MSSQVVDETISYSLLDKFGYRRLGLVESWSKGDAVLLLASFEMLTKGLWGHEDEAQHKSRLYNDYVVYVSSLIDSGKLDYDYDNKLINKDKLLEILEGNSTLKLDVARLRRFLSCDEDPGTISNVNHKTAPVDTNEVSVLANTDHTGADVLDSSQGQNSRYVFKLKGYYWEVVYCGKQALIKNSLGVKYIGYLIANKHKLLSWADLYKAVNGVAPETIAPNSEEEDVSSGFNLSEGKPGRIYAGSDKKKLQAQINDLNDDLASAKACVNEDEADRIEEQIEQIKKYVMDTYRADGTLKEEVPETDKMADSIKAAIKRALKDIERELPELRKHLNDNIVLKWQRVNPGYSPALDHHWEV